MGVSVVELSCDGVQEIQVRITRTFFSEWIKNVGFVLLNDYSQPKGNARVWTVAMKALDPEEKQTL